MATSHVTDSDADRFAEAAMRWHGWGSPIGLGVFLVCLALAGLVVAQTVRTFTDAGAGRPHTELQSPDSRR